MTADAAVPVVSLDLDAIEARAAAATCDSYMCGTCSAVRPIAADIRALVDALRRARDCAVALEQECARLTEQRDAVFALCESPALVHRANVLLALGIES